ncbi:MAG: sensor histidine kinase [Saprospiraceae bacterium]
MNKIVNYFLPNYSDRDKKAQNKAAFLVYSLLGVCLITIIWSPYLILTLENHLLIPALVSCLICLFTLWYLKRNQNLEVSIILFSINGLCLFFYVILISGGSSSPFLIWLILFPVVPVLIGNRRAFKINVISCILFVVFLGIFNYIEFEFRTLITIEKTGLHSVLSIATLGVFFTFLTFQYDKENKKYTEQLDQSNKELEKFAYIASHDMKEPLRNIISFSQLLKKRSKGRLKENENEYLEIVLNNAHQLHALVENVLEFSRSSKDAGKNLKQVDLNEIIKEVNFNLKTILIEKNAQIIYSDLPQIEVAEIQMVQLFQNLIENGIKYNKSDRPVVNVSMTSNEDKRYIFDITDNGIGIDAEYHNQIFEMFKRLHTRKEYEGTGIGLALCKKIAQQYGGDLIVKKSSNEGTTFRLMFPKG